MRPVSAVSAVSAVTLLLHGPRPAQAGRRERKWPPQQGRSYRARVSSRCCRPVALRRYGCRCPVPSGGRFAGDIILPLMEGVTDALR